MLFLLYETKRRYDLLRICLLSKILEILFQKYDFLVIIFRSEKNKYHHWIMDIKGKQIEIKSKNERKNTIKNITVA